MSETTDKSAFTIKEFCQRNSISTPTYYKLRGQRQGPVEMRTIGTLIRISAEAERDWQRSLEKPEGALVAEIEASKARLKRRSSAASSAPRGAQK